MNKPNFMSDEIYEALVYMLKSPWSNWTMACGMKKPKWYNFRKTKSFIHLVEVTKMTIKETLSYKFYPETYIPRVEAKLIHNNWHLIVHTWGHPLNVKIR